ncbi:DUF420 domain-containing protein [Vulgatibacter incomptus]|uniref:DUF420 domain-containing protein n=1 Tax=Vulgatibacter incomptus TaxID=1391653 RepID=A0A0K1PC23_9BACT|nr:DUF420 domain-containing protein [Vulgatibacter incomptus]AKU91052.1 hypothetical protein AKJ08_1439 [Vulgatibacter incomptus]
MELHPLINACLNGTSAILLFLGLRAIKQGKRERHKKLMLGAFGASSVFLASYLLRFAISGTTRFPVEGVWKVAYLAVLFSHMFLAIALLPMVLRTLWLPLTGRFEPHRRIARFTFPIWAYVSVTGVAVYLMLYHLPSLLL